MNEEEGHNNKRNIEEGWNETIKKYAKEGRTLGDIHTSDVVSKLQPKPGADLIDRYIRRSVVPKHNLSAQAIVPTTVPTIMIPRDTLPPAEKEALKFKLAMNLQGMVIIKPTCKEITTFLSSYDNDTVTYQLKEKFWLFKPKIYHEVIVFLKKQKHIFNEIPKAAITVANKTIPNIDFNLKGEIYEKLLPFQMAGVKLALNLNGRVILADDMGLGKTIQALAISYYYQLEWPLLIIAPASLLDGWSESIKKFMYMEATVVRSRYDLGDRICIISYDMAAKCEAQLAGLKYKIIICDECHFLKSTSSKRSNKLVPLLQSASRLILISGTPALSRPIELYPLISAIDKSLFPTFTLYGNRYCNGRKVGNWYDYKGCSNAEELYSILNKCLMIRRLKSEVMNDLPPKVRKCVHLDVPQTEETEEQANSDPRKKSEILKMYAESSEIKVPAVIEYIEEALLEPTRFLVFAHHQSMLSALNSYLEQKGVDFIKIDGTTPPNQRQLLCNKFQTDDKYKVALLSLTAASTGLTLTKATMVIFVELYWNPGTLLQAEDRIHRIGQTSKVIIKYLLFRKTIDEIVWPKLLSKLKVLDSLGVGGSELESNESTDLMEFFK